MLDTIKKEQCDVVCANFNIKYKYGINKASCFSNVDNFEKTHLLYQY